jgi:hypothetical protein
MEGQEKPCTEQDRNRKGEVRLALLTQLIEKT